MKVSLFSAVLCLVLSLASLGIAHITLSHSAKAVQFTPQSCQGDPNAVTGLQAELCSALEDRLFWTSTLPLNCQGETDFRFSPQSPPIVSNPRNAQFSFFPHLNSSWQSIGAPLDLEQLSAPLRESFLQLAQEAKPGSTLKKTVPLHTVFTDYPLEIQLYPGDGSILRPEAVQAVSDAFHFSVPPDQQVILSVTRSENGDLQEVGISRLPDQEEVQFESIYTFTDTNLYFILEVRDQSGALLDDSRTPHGRGIYCLPSLDRPYTLADLRFLCPLEPEQRPLLLSFIPEENQLLLYSTRADTEELQIIDGESGQELQRLSVEQENTAVWYLQSGQNGIFLRRSNDRFTFFAQDEAGTYRKAFDGQLPSDFPSGLNFEICAAYNGERLALMGLDSWIEGRSVGYCSPRLAVYDASGLLYTGTYRCSLDESTVPPSVEKDQWDRNQFCRLSPPQALRLQWAE